MGSPIYADDHSYEIIREYAHLSRRKMTDILRDLISPLEVKMEKEFGVRVPRGKGPQVRAENITRKVRATK